MRRREFITLLGGTTAAWPLAARAQQSDRMRRISVLMGAFASTDPEGQVRFAAFLNTLQGLGWTIGRNFQMEVRWATDDIERTKANAAELVDLAPDVIVVVASQALAELQRLSRTIPIVFVQLSDPVGGGFVPSLARPGGNITGFQNFEPEMGGKWLGLLKEAAPNIIRVAVLLHPETDNNLTLLRSVEAVAPSLGMQVTAAGVHDGVEIERAISTFATRPDGGLIVVPQAITVTHRGSIIELVARHRLPAIYPFRYFATEGGLISYGPPDLVEQWRGAARYVDRILRGEKPGDLPVQAPTKYELVINLKTAKALGIKILESFLLRADEVIE
jgi:ABC-type uncharacterized transport system substrate-binding protein